MKKGFGDFLSQESPDILALQEVKSKEIELPYSEYDVFWNAGQRPGYSGTAVLSKKAPKNVTYGLGNFLEDTEGRVITLEFDSFFFVTTYTPNSGRGLVRLDYRTNEWNPAFQSYLAELSKQRDVIFCGDLNVAHEEIDIARPGPNRKSAGFTKEERADFSSLLQSGFIDTFRLKYPDTIAYSYWSYRSQARARNVGWRLDYFCVSEGLVSRVSDAEILSSVHGSDHCPVRLVLSS